MEKLELQKHYIKLVNDIESFSETKENETDISVLIYTNEWVRIYLQAILEKKQIKLQVEVFSSKNLINSGAIELQTALSMQIMYLKYLMELTRLDFVLGFIHEEGIWFCSKFLKQEPSGEFIEQIHPENFTKRED